MNIVHSQILKHIPISEGSVVVNVGSCIGICSSDVCKCVGEYGKVYSIDTNQLNVDRANNEIKDFGVKNVYAALGDICSEGNICIQEENADVLILNEVLLGRSDIDSVISECHRLLKPNGYVVIFEKKPLDVVFYNPKFYFGDSIDIGGLGNITILVKN